MMPSLIGFGAIVEGVSTELLLVLIRAVVGYRVSETVFDITNAGARRFAWLILLFINRSCTREQRGKNVARTRRGEHSKYAIRIKTSHSTSASISPLVFPLCIYPVLASCWLEGIVPGPPGHYDTDMEYRSVRQ